MRIGTWNLAGRNSDAHAAFLAGLNCDVLLLTEVRDDVRLPGYDRHLAVGEMATGRRWAGVFSRIGLTTLPDPHPTSNLAQVGELTFCSSVLPWRSCGSDEPWTVGSLADRTRHVVDQLVRELPSGSLVWGGDWNHALEGPELSGSREGRECLTQALGKLNLRAPTSALCGRRPGMNTIDHIAVPASEQVDAVTHRSAVVGTRALSDHDAYVVELLDS